MQASVVLQDAERATAMSHNRLFLEKQIQRTDDFHPSSSGKNKKCLPAVRSSAQLQIIYNCFQRVEISSGTFRPIFAHLREIQFKESYFKVKQAYKLTLKVLSPTNMEKTNVILDDDVFHESSSGALKYYAKEDNRPESKDTAQFVESVRTMWNIFNVKTPS
ncbi:Putative LOC100205425, partial [Caligus rogercresseyi]